jgi:hypothetical protein
MLARLLAPFLLLLQGITAAPSHGQDASAPLAYDGYAGVLEAHVIGEGMVDYRGLWKSPGELEAFVDKIARLPRARFEAWPKKDQIAFLINAYNALTLEAIIDHYPIRARDENAPKAGIRQIEGVWDRLAFELMGRRVTLNHIEHEMLRKGFDEPRIHMALVCAAKSCPRLRNEPFRGHRLDDQLKDQTRKFLSHPAKFRIDRGRKQVYLSEIFNWFGQDFVKSFGTSSAFEGRSEKERAVLNFIAKHIKEDDAAYLFKNTYAIRYLPYDWSLNGK